MHPAAQAWPPAFSPDEVESARATLDRTGHLCIVGPLGSSRGMLAALVTEAPLSGGVWWRSDASRVRDTTPYTALNQLLPALPMRPDLPLDDAVERARAHLESTLTGGERPTLILREADLSDTESLRVLVRLAERQVIRLVTTASPGFETQSVLGSPRVVALGPLDPTVIAYLLERRFGAEAHPTTVSLLAARSQGAYRVMCEIAEIEVAAGRIQVVAGVLVPTSTPGREGVDLDTDPVSDAFRRPTGDASGDPLSDVLEVTALVHALVESEAIDAFGEQNVRRAVTSGMVSRGDGLLRFSSLAEATLVQRSLGIARRRALHARYADRLRRSFARPDVADQVATWSLTIDHALTPDLAVRAAIAANASGKYARAIRVAESIPEAERPAHLVVEHLHALHETGATEAIDSILRGVDLSTVGDVDLFALLRSIRAHLDPEATKERLVAVRRQAADDPARLLTLELLQQFTDALNSATEAQGRQLESLLVSPYLTPINRGIALTALAAWARHSGRPEQAVGHATEAVEVFESLGAVRSTWHLEWAREILVLSQMSAADLAGAERTLEQYSAPGAAHGNFGRLGLALWGAHAFFSGNIRASLANFGVALQTMPLSDPHQVRAWCEAMLAQAVAQAGEVDHVEDLLHKSRSRPHGRMLQFELERRIAEACALDSIGDPDAALELLDVVADRAREGALRLNEVDAAVLCVQIGGPQYNWKLLRATDDLIDPSGTPLVWKRFADAIRDNHMPALLELAIDLERRGSWVFAAEVARFTLDVARRASDMTADQRALLESIADPMAHRHVTRPPS